MMNFLCLQLEATCLELRFFAYSCAWELVIGELLLQLELTLAAFSLTLEASLPPGGLLE